MKLGKRWTALGAALLCCGLVGPWGCAHGAAGPVATLPALGPRSHALVLDEPLRAEGKGDALCVGVPDGWTVDAAGKLRSPAGVAVALEAGLGSEGTDPVPLPVASARTIGGAPYLCLAPAAPLVKGRRFGRISLRSAESLIAPDIRWVPGTP